MTENNQTVTYGLTGLHCCACVGRVTKSLEALAANVVVSLNPMQVVLTDATANFEELQTAVASSGKCVLLPDLLQN